MEEPFKISVVGAGLAGVAATILLSRIPGTQVTLYERSETPREAGGTLGITPNAQIIVESMMKDNMANLNRILYQNAPAESRNWKTGIPLDAPPPDPLAINEGNPKKGNVSCLRRHLHEVLLGEVPDQQVKGGMKGLGLKVTEDGVECKFENGEVIKSDLVIISDGIKSRLRDSLGLKADVKFSGVVEYMEIVPKEQVAHIANLPSSPALYSGSGTNWLVITPAGPDYYGIIISTMEDISTAGSLGWSEDGGIERLTLLRTIFGDWNQVVVDFLGAMTNVGLFPVYRGEWLEDLAMGGRVALIGDAAHPTGGAYSAGAGLSFCDVEALKIALEHVAATEGSIKDPQNLAKALNLYSQTRSKLLARVFASIKADAGEKPAEIKNDKDQDDMSQWATKALGADLSWLRFHDVGEEFKKVLRKREFV